MRFRSLILIPACLLCFAANASIVFGQNVDDGNTDDLSIAANAAFNAIDLLEVPLAELGQLENRTIVLTKTNLIDLDEASARMYGLSKAYASRGKNTEAKRIAAVGVDLSPDTLGAAKCLLIFGNLTMNEEDGFNRAIKPFQQADAILKKLIDKKPDDAFYLYRAVMLDRLGTCYETTRQFDKANEVYEEMAVSPDVARCGGVERVAAANVALGRMAVAAGNVDKTRKYYDRLSEIAKSNSLSVEDALRYQLQRINAVWPKHDDPDRLLALKELWGSPRYREVGQILEVGDDLQCHSFFKIPQDKKQFESVSQEMNQRIRNIVDRNLLDGGVVFPSRFDAIHATSLVLATDFANSKLDHKKAKICVEEFNKVFKEKVVTFSIPQERPIEQLVRLRELYRSTMVEHWKECVRRQVELDDL